MQGYLIQETTLLSVLVLIHLPFLLCSPFGFKLSTMCNSLLCSQRLAHYVKLRNVPIMCIRKVKSQDCGCEIPLLGCIQLSSHEEMYFSKKKSE